MSVHVPERPQEDAPGKVLAALGSSLAKGLSDAEAEARLAQFGRNELPEVPPTPFWKLVLAQFEDTLVRILLAAAAVSFAMACFEEGYGGFVEPFVILLILIANATVGVVQENRAEQAIDALKDFVPKKAHCLRGGQLQSVAAETLVPGDVVEVAVGMRVPADCRVCELLSTTLRADQAILNGESVEAIKHAEPLTAKQATAEGAFAGNMVFSGTAIVYGKARCVVIRTGATTEIGSIERGVREQEETKTPLQIKLDEFGDLLSKYIGWICLAVLAIHMARWYSHPRDPNGTFWDNYAKHWIECMKIAVALAVAAIPEGLPAVVTTCLALGTRRMARHNALVRELPSVETLGRCTVVCSDKTGTLTTNTMSVIQVFTLAPGAKSGKDLNLYAVEDTQYAPGVDKVRNARTDAVVAAATVRDRDAALAAMAEVAVMCNDASLQHNTRTGAVEKNGESTEAALLTMAEKVLSRDPTDIAGATKAVKGVFTRNATLEFTRQRKSMGVHVTGRGGHMLMVKGAPEAVLGRCTHFQASNGAVAPLTPATRAAVLAQVSDMASNAFALRCIGFAVKNVGAAGTLKGLDNPANFDKVEEGMTFVGVAGMLDPPRLEVAEAVAKCNTAGIRVVVITGDNKETAEAICRRIGVLPDDRSRYDELSFTGQDLDMMTLAEKKKMIHTARLFSRTNPSHKLQLVDLLQQERLICAMTGDGVNDAPALKKADIGIAMGTGTEVAKAASKMVLADDNFASVVHAVKEGRAIYNNTKQFIRYLISSNIGEVFCVLTTGILGIPEALVPVQLLWVNLVTDGLPATALGFNPPDPDIMDQPPRRTDEPIVNGWLFFRYLIIGAYVGLATVGGFIFWFIAHGISLWQLMDPSKCGTDAFCTASIANPAEARAVALSILVVVEMFNALNALSENQSIVTLRPTANPWLLLAICSSMALHFAIMYVPILASTFNITPLAWPEWRIVLVFSIPVVFVDEVLKLATRLLTTHDHQKKLQ